MVNIYKGNISRTKAEREEFALSLIDGINASTEKKKLPREVSESGKPEVHMKETVMGDGKWRQQDQRKI